MATRRAPAAREVQPPPQPPSTRPTGTETVALPVEVHRVRVMFADGATVDFLTVDRGGSHMREAALKHHYGTRSPKEQGQRIEGVADLGVEYTHTPEVPA